MDLSVVIDAVGNVLDIKLYALDLDADLTSAFGFVFLGINLLTKFLGIELASSYFHFIHMTEE